MIKRLILDVETSPNLVFCWSTGYRLNISPENIVKERALICACWKWEGEDKVHSATWDKGDDRELCIKLAEILNEADEVVGHNSAKFDVPWIRTRCIFHGIAVNPDIVDVDTLKLAKKAFRFNSNKLSYITEFLGLPTKIHVDYDLWKQVVLDNSELALSKMVRYCKQDVRITEQAYQKLQPYGAYKTHVGVLNGNSKSSCPKCGSEDVQKRGTHVSAAGTRSQTMSCNVCGRRYTISMTEAKREEKVNAKQPDKAV